MPNETSKPRAPAAITTLNTTALEIAVDPAVNYIQGSVTSYFVPLERTPSITFDLVVGMQVDSIVYHGGDASYTHGLNNILEVFFPDTLTSFVVDSVTVHYQGVPEGGGLGTFSADTNAYGNPNLWTLSQPYGARDWWPCKQELTDKVDSLDMWITTPSQYTAASNGLLKAELVDGAQTTYVWKHRYPIAPYLVAFTVAEYTVYTDTAMINGTPLEIVNYVYPEDEEAARRGTMETPAVMVLFDSLFGPYPFDREQYGHAQFTRGGGMEHQTMSFMGDFGYELMVHELAHQWFGDKVTCGDWGHIWLNEGFATYLTGIAYEFQADGIYFMPWKRFVSDRALLAPNGSVQVNNLDSVPRIFDYSLSYCKGAFVLQMVRWVVGDEAFFSGLRNYLEASNLAYGFAVTDHLRYHLEQTSGMNLGGFFNDWFTGSGHPEYRLEWAQNSQNQVRLKVFQSQTHPSVDFFEMPIPVGFYGPQGDTIVRLEHDFSGQSFSFPLDFVADSVVFNPEITLLAGHDSVQRVAYPVLSGAKGLTVYPNPVTDRLSIDLAPFTGNVSLDVSNGFGKAVLRQELTTTGATIAPYWIDCSSWPAGAYVVRVVSSSEERTARFVKVK